MSSIPSRPALKYHGGKWRLASWIIAQFPPHSTYVEPFGGGASVLLQKKPVGIEVYNDLDRLVVNFFRVLRERPDELIRAIDLTPFSREEHTASEQAYTMETDDPLELARVFYVRIWQSFGSGTRHNLSGWKYQRNPKVDRSQYRDWNNIAHLWDIVDRLKNCYIECDDGMKVIERFDTPDTLFYVDPPYVWSSRAEGRRGYAHELSDEQHIELSKLLHRVKGMVVLSGYKTELYDTLYADWRCLLHESRTLVSGQKGSKQIAMEYLWLSPNAEAKQTQLRLFDL